MARKLKFDILAFLELHGVDYRTSGKNCAKGHCVVSCPMCEAEGDPDPSMHMGIELSSGHWGCWRSSHHRGKKLTSLMTKLTGISFKEAAQLVGDAAESVDKEEFDALAQWLSGIEEQANPAVQSPPKTLPMPSSFRPITDSRFAQPFRRYLEKKRGFRRQDIDKVIKTYDLRYCVQSGSWQQRLILPIYRDNKLGTYTGRSVDPNEQLRYNSLSKDKSVVNIKETIYDYDGLMNTTGRALFVVEGPLDMLKMDFYGRAYDCRTTCLFSKTATPEQIADLYNVHRNFAYVVVLLDAGEAKSASALLDELSLIPNLMSLEIPYEGVDDPADLYPSEIAEICSEI